MLTSGSDDTTARLWRVEKRRCPTPLADVKHPDGTHFRGGMRARACLVAVVARIVIMLLCASAAGSTLPARALAYECARARRPLALLALRGGAAPDHGPEGHAAGGLVRKRQRLPGVSFQAVVDSAEAHRFFTAQELGRLRRQFVPEYTGKDSANDTVPAGMLAQLRLRISIRRDKYSRSIITGQPISVSEDEGLEEAQQAPPTPSRSAARRAPVHGAAGAPGSDVHAAVLAAVAHTQKLAERGESGASVIDGGLKRVRGQHETEVQSLSVKAPQWLSVVNVLGLLPSRICTRTTRCSTTIRRLSAPRTRPALHSTSTPLPPRPPLQAQARGRANRTRHEMAATEEARPARVTPLLGRTQRRSGHTRRVRTRKVRS